MPHGCCPATAASSERTGSVAQIPKAIHLCASGRLAGRHGQTSPPTYKTRNWPACNRAKHRGSLTSNRPAQDAVRPLVAAPCSAAGSMGAGPAGARPASRAYGRRRWRAGLAVDVVEFGGDNQGAHEGGSLTAGSRPVLARPNSGERSASGSFCTAPWRGSGSRGRSGRRRSGIESQRAGFWCR